jgi:hypothetical protein
VRKAAGAFALGVEPMARFEWAGMIAIVMGGLVLNALLIHIGIRWVQRRWPGAG